MKLTFTDEKAQPYKSYKNDKVGVVLVHGFTGSPSHMRMLALYLEENGYSVNSILLSGHNTTVKEMRNSNYVLWRENVRKAVLEMRKQCEKVAICGLSMGGVLGNIMASEGYVDTCISIAAPVKLQDKVAPLARYIHWLIPNVGKVSATTKSIYEYSDYHYGYRSTPTKKVADLLKLIKMSEKMLCNIKCPMLIIQSEDDATIKSISANIIYDKTGSETKELFWLKDAGHILTISHRKDTVNEKILDFLQKNM